MQNTYKQIYHLIKDADYFQSKTIKIGGQVFIVTCEKDASIIRYYLDYWDNEKIIRLHSSGSFSCMLTEERIKRIARAFFDHIMCRCIYDIRIYRSEKRISRSDLKKCVNSHEEIAKHGLEFYGWRKKDNYLYNPLYVIA